MLEISGLVDKLCIDKDGNVLDFKSNHDLFYPVRHITPTNPTNDINISPVGGYLFAACIPMKNVRRLTGSGGCNKYFNKFIAKVDTHNFIFVEVEGQGKPMTKAYFLHNRKVASSNMQEDKYRSNHDGKYQGWCISLIEMMHAMLKYLEVFTNLEFIHIKMLSLEL